MENFINSRYSFILSPAHTLTLFDDDDAAVAADAVAGGGVIYWSQECIK